MKTKKKNDTNSKDDNINQRWQLGRQHKWSEQSTTSNNNKNDDAEYDKNTHEQSKVGIN